MALTRKKKLAINIGAFILMLFQTFRYIDHPKNSNAPYWLYNGANILNGFLLGACALTLILTFKSKD